MIVDQHGKMIEKSIDIIDTSAKLEKMLMSQLYHTAAGIVVTHENALQVPAVLACLQVISQSTSMLPFTVYKKDGDSRVKDTENEIYQLLSLCPNKFQSPVEFVRTMTFNAAWAGNAYALINRSRRRIFQLIPLAPGACKVEMKSDGSLEYTVTTRENGHAVVETYDSSQIFHLRGLLSRKGWVGESPIDHGRGAIATALAAEKFGGDFFSEGAKSRGAFRVPEGVKSLSDEAFERLSNELNAAVNSRRSPLFEHGIEWVNMDYNPQQSQLTELRAMQVYEICRLWRVQPHMIQSLDKASFSNIEHQAREFIDHTLMPWIRQWETAIKVQLMDPKDETVYPKFSVQALLRGDTKTRLEALFKVTGSPFLTVNEARALEDMNPIADGDQLYHPVNMARAGEDPPDTEKINEEPEAA